MERSSSSKRNPTLVTTSGSRNTRDETYTNGAGEGGTSTTLINFENESRRRNDPDDDGEVVELASEGMRELERRLVRKVDLRLCTIAGILCSLNLCEYFIYSFFFPPLFGLRWET